MICNSCGNQNPDNAVFCRFCGTPIQNTAESDISPKNTTPENMIASGSTSKDSGPIQNSSLESGRQQISAAHARMLNIQNQTAGSIPSRRYVDNASRGQNRNYANNYGNNPYGNTPHGSTPNTAYPYGNNPYGGTPNTAYPYGRNPNARDPYGRPYAGPGPAKVSAPSKWLLLLILEAAAALVVIAIAISLFSSSGNAEKIAENYFISLVNGDYEKAFSYMNLEEDTFINPEELKIAYVYLDLSKVDNYSIVENTETYYNSYESQNSSNQLGKTVWVLYRNMGDSSNSEMPIAVTKSGKKNKWYISSNEFILNNTKIVVPRGAKVTIDGINVPDEYAVEETDSYSGMNTTVFYIPRIFMGSHFVSVNAEGYQEYKAEWSFNSNEERFEALDLLFTNQEMEAIQAQAVSNMKEIYQAALNHQSFDTIADLFTEDSDVLEDIQSDYDSLVEQMSGENYWISSLDVQSIEALSYTNSSNVDVSFTCSGIYHQKNYNGEINDATGTTDARNYFSFKRENGSWVQTSIGCGKIYF